MSTINEDMLNSNFPLFDLLYKGTADKSEFTNEEMQQLITNLQFLFTKSNADMIRNILFVIIRIYSNLKS